MNILWLSWKDSNHPQAGGAEVVKQEICKRLVASGCNVKQVVSGFPGAEKITQKDGCKIIRLGGRYTVYFLAWRYYRANLRGWADLVIDECNTVPFFASRYVREPNALVIYQLAREVWFYQMKPPISWIGKFLEPFYLRLLRPRKILTICESTKRELLTLGFNSKIMSIIRMGSDLAPLKKLPNKDENEDPTLLYFGSLREMKRPDHVIEAFRFAAQKLPRLGLVMAGGGDGYYVEHLIRLAELSGLKDRIVFTGRVSVDEKLQLMKRADLIVVTSVKEGWGLIVTEAASQGTPAVVYDVDGLRDSVLHRKTGLVMPPSPKELAEGIVEMFTNRSLYSQCRQQAWEWSKELNFDNTYRDFCAALKI